MNLKDIVWNDDRVPGRRVITDNGERFEPLRGAELREAMKLARQEEVKERKPKQTLKFRKKLRLKSKVTPKAKLNGSSRFLFEWRNAFCAETKKRLPATTRHVLLTISLFMDNDGSRAYPGQERLKRDTGLSLPAVKQHIALAVERGWLRRELNHKSRYGIGYSYTARIPDAQGVTSLPGKEITRQRHGAKGATSRD